MRDVVITHAHRTPIGRFLGQFQSLSAVELGSALVEEILRRSGLPADAVDQFYFGCARQAGLGPNPARQIALRSGLPDTLPSVTTNMACGSGLLAVIQAARMIRLGEAEVVVAGGVESMSNVPHLLPKLRMGYRMGHAPAEDAMFRDGFDCPLAEQRMGRTAENLVERYAISREEQDAFAARSQNRAEAAWAAGRFTEEVLPVRVTGRKGAVTTCTEDEHYRKGVVAEKLAKLPAVFREGGSVTAGNSSGITDGAAALLVMSREAAERHGLPVFAVLEDWQAAGVDPKIMGIGPVPATRTLLERLGRPLDAYGVVELNEAFAAQVLACDRELKLDHEKLNLSGGAIALGHPIGATGARISTTLLHEMKHRDSELGLATLCISGGQGLAVSFRRPA